MDNWYQKFVKTASPTDDFEFFKDPWVKVESSFIDALAYFPLARVLEVRMKAGNKYTFMGVPKDIYEAFLVAPSKGSFFKLVRQNYTKS